MVLKDSIASSCRTLASAASATAFFAVASLVALSAVCCETTCRFTRKSHRWAVSAASCALAWALASASDRSLRNSARAIELAEAANRSFRGENAIPLHVLAAAYAENGEFDKAIEIAQRELMLLGADLEERGLATVGWQAVVDAWPHGRVKPKEQQAI